MRIHTSCLLTLAFLGYSTGAEAKCEAVDMVFVVDSSSSIWPGNYDLHVKPFIKDVINMFHVGKGDGDSRIGVVTFSDNVHLQFNLNQFLTQNSVNKAIEGIKFLPGNTFTNKAIEYASMNMFTSRFGARKDVQDVIIVLTDGESRNPELTKAAANLAKTKGITIFAIGVGSDVKFTELTDMASEPSDTFVFALSEFSALRSIKNNFGKNNCEVIASTTRPLTTKINGDYMLNSTTEQHKEITESSTTIEPPTTTVTTNPSTTTVTTESPTTTVTTESPATTVTAGPSTATITAGPSTTNSSTVSTTTPTSKIELKDHEIQGDTDSNATYCGGKPADIFFVLDSSSSVWIEDFNIRMLSFVRDVVDSFEISPNKVRVGMVVYSDTVKPVFGLKAHQDRESLLKAIQPETVKYMSGLTNTADSIRFVRNVGFKRSGSARPGAAHIIVVITDGISKHPRATKFEADKAKKDGVYIFAIGVGPYIDQQELENISNDPSEQFVYNVKNYGALNSIREFLAAQACKIIPTPTPVKDAEFFTGGGCNITTTDIHFVYESGSKSSMERSALKSVIRRFSENDNNKKAPIRLGVVTDPCKTYNKIPFSNIENFHKTLENMKSKRKVQMHLLVRKVRRRFKSSQLRTDKLMILFVDETTTNLKKLANEANNAKFKGFQVFVVAIGKIKSKIIHEIASKPTSRYVRRVDTYKDLDNVDIDVLDVLCAQQPKPATPTGSPKSTRWTLQTRKPY